MAYLFVRKKLAPRESGLTVFHGFGEAVFLFEVTSHYILYSIREIAAFLSRPLCESSLQIGSEINFHALKISYWLCTGNRPT